MKSFFMAFSTLTPFHVSIGKWTSSQLKRSVIFYPLVGMVIGGLLVIARNLPLANHLQAIIVLILWVILTMAFHLDGLGDCLDGWFGGRTSKDRHRIMKDAALGVYGATGIVLILLSKYVFLDHLFTKADAGRWLVVIPTAARWSVTLSCFVFHSPPRDKGLGSKVVNQSLPSFLAASGFLLIGIVFLLQSQILLIIGLSVFISVGVGLISKNRIGGLTGDGMGATIELTETSLLLLSCLI